MAATMTLAPIRSSTSRSNNTAWTVSSASLRYSLPLPVPSSASSRAATSLFALNRKLSRILKVAIGAVLGCLGIIAAWWALDLAMWTAVKEWRDDCREQKQLTKTTSEQCKDILSKELSPPPTWRSFLQKIPNPMEPYYYKTDSHGANVGNYTLVPRDIFDWDGTGVGEKFRMYRDASTRHEQDNPDDRPEFGALEALDRMADGIFELWHRYHNSIYTEGGRHRLACKSPRRSFLERVIDDIVQRAECDMICYEGIRKQGDAKIMYAGVEHYNASIGTVGYLYDDLEETIDDLLWRGDCAVNCLEGIKKQRPGDIMIFGMENYTTLKGPDRFLYNVIAGLVGVHRSRVNPIRKPCWWAELAEEGEAGAARPWEAFLEPVQKGPPACEEPLGPVLCEEGRLDWSAWSEELAFKNADKISVHHAGDGSVEYLDIQVLPPKPNVWRRGCPCEPPVHHTTVGVGGLNVFDGPSWILWETLSTWTAVLMLFVYWDFMSGGPGRRKREDDERRKQKQKREKLKKS